MLNSNKTNRSRLANRSALFLGNDVDGRSADARRFREVYQGLLDLLPPTALTDPVADVLARTAAGVAIDIEHLLAQQVRAKKKHNAGELVRASNSFARLLTKLNIDVTRTPAAPGSAVDDDDGETLESYLAKKNLAKARKRKRKKRKNT